MFQAFAQQRDRAFPAAVALLIGGAGGYFALPVEPALFWIALPVLAGLIAWLGRHQGTVRFLACALLAIGIGFSAAFIETHYHPPLMLDAALPPTGVTGIVYHSEPLPDGATRLTLQAPLVKGWPEDKPFSFVRIKINKPYAEAPLAGQRVSLWGPLWPAGDQAYPGGYDFRRNAFFNDLSATGLNYGEIRAADPLDPDFSLTVLIEKARRYLTLLVLGRDHDDAGAMTAALLTGGQGILARPIMDAMRASGLSHLLSISGLHVSMIGLLIFVPLRFLLALWPWVALRYPIQKIAAAGAILSTATYAAFIGPEAPVVRSALMSGAVMFAVLTDRRSQSMRLVALAAAIIVVFSPSSVLSPSFQMSFAAVLAMVAAFEKSLDTAMKDGVTLSLPRPIQQGLKALRDILLTSMVATAATAPFTLYHFQTVNLYGLAANILAIPLTTFWIMPNLLLTYIAAPLGGAGLFLDAAHWGCEQIIWIAQTVASWPYASLNVPPVPLWAFILAVIALFWITLCRWKLRWLGILPVLAAGFYPLNVPMPDILVASDGKNWIVRMEDDAYATYGHKKENFALRSWSRILDKRPLQLYTKDTPPDPAGPLRCEGAVCFYQKEPLSLAFLAKRAKPQEIEAACQRAHTVIAPFALTDCAAAEKIDAPKLAAEGAQAFFVENGNIRIQSARQAGQSRPWSPQGSIADDQE